MYRNEYIEIEDSVKLRTAECTGYEKAVIFLDVMRDLSLLELFDKIRAPSGATERLPVRNEVEELKTKMHKIVTWIDTYPLDVFPEPDFRKAHEVLMRHGMTLDSITASNMRRVLSGVRDIIDEGDVNENETRT